MQDEQADVVLHFPLSIFHIRSQDHLDLIVGVTLHSLLEGCKVGMRRIAYNEHLPAAIDNISKKRQSVIDTFPLALDEREPHCVTLQTSLLGL